MQVLFPLLFRFRQPVSYTHLILILLRHTINIVFIRFLFGLPYEYHPVVRGFGACQIRSENDAGAYKTNLLMEEWAGYLQEMKESSIYDTGITPEGNEKLVTLSTCINRKERLIIQALLSGGS